jgi:hypothetical protein
MLITFLPRGNALPCSALVKIFFSRTTVQEKLKVTQKFSDIVQEQVCENHDPPSGRVWQKEMKCISIGKNLYMWASVTQVSDVAHGPFTFSYTSNIHYTC